MSQQFFEYEKKLGINCLIPFLEKQGIELSHKSVLDLGCGYGGVLEALNIKYTLAMALGIDLDSEMITAGQKKISGKVSLKNEDFFSFENERFDFILVRDALEHIGDVEKALVKAVQLLNIGGLMYISFAPFYSPFGGHQHNGEGLFSNFPWIQFLPEAWFRKLIKFPGNEYKTQKGLAADMESVLQTRLTIRRLRMILPKVGLKIKFHKQYLVRPDYKIKFGLPEISFPAIPFLDDLVCTGYEAVLVKSSEA